MNIKFNITKACPVC